MRLIEGWTAEVLFILMIHGSFLLDKKMIKGGDAYGD
jgi:hypothetical protein